MIIILFDKYKEFNPKFCKFWNDESNWELSGFFSWAKKKYLNFKINVILNYNFNIKLSTLFNKEYYGCVMIEFWKILFNLSFFLIL